MAGVERGVLPMGDWSMTTRRLKCSVPCTRRGISFFPERARLASQLGGGLSGVLYILDEPTAGLHPADTDRLLDVYKRQV